jgi:hypothetical protein
MLVDVVKCAHENQIYLLSDRFCVLLNVLHLCHKLLQPVLDFVFFMYKRDILSCSFSTCVGMSIFDSEDPLIPVERFILPRSPITHASARDNALRAECLAEVGVEKLKSFLVRLALTET